MSVEQKLREFIYCNFVFDDHKDFRLKNDDSFLEKGVIDSTGVLELVEFLADEFGVEVEDEELTLENLDSIDKVRNFLDRKMGRVPEEALC